MDYFLNVKRTSRVKTQKICILDISILSQRGQVKMCTCFLPRPCLPWSPYWSSLAISASMAYCSPLGSITLPCVGLMSCLLYYNRYIHEGIGHILFIFVFISYNFLNWKCPNKQKLDDEYHEYSLYYSYYFCVCLEFFIIKSTFKKTSKKLLLLDGGLSTSVYFLLLCIFH